MSDRAPAPSPRVRPRRTERAASAVEYGLLISGIAAVIVAAVFIFGGNVAGIFTNTCQTVAAQTSQSCS